MPMHKLGLQPGRSWCRPGPSAPGAPRHATPRRAAHPPVPPAPAPGPPAGLRAAPRPAPAPLRRAGTHAASAPRALNPRAAQVPSRFFQRIHFDYTGISVGPGNLAVLEKAVADLAQRYGMQWTVSYWDKPKKVRQQEAGRRSWDSRRGPQSCADLWAQGAPGEEAGRAP